MKTMNPALQFAATMLPAVVLTFAITESSFAHVRITPVGRMGASDATKFIQRNKANPNLVPDSPGPCQNFRTRMATPLQLTGGQSFTFQVQETINHPGRFYVQFSRGGDAGFWEPANQLALVEDPNNRATTPVTFTVPDMNCTTCTFRVLQEMDEQPNEFYVHCVDANITASTSSLPPPPTPIPSEPGGTEGASSVTEVAAKPGFGGCGLVGTSGGGSAGGPGPSGKSAPLFVLLLLLAPLAIASVLRAHRISPKGARSAS